MLVFDQTSIGNKLLSFRKKKGLTQAEVAELSGLSDRTYADIERGYVNMRTETILKICNALKITPNDIFTTEHNDISTDIDLLFSQLNLCSESEKETALKILSVYLNSLN